MIGKMRLTTDCPLPVTMCTLRSAAAQPEGMLDIFFIKILLKLRYKSYPFEEREGDATTNNNVSLFRYLFGEQDINTR